MVKTVNGHCQTQLFLNAPLMRVPIPLTSGYLVATRLGPPNRGLRSCSEDFIVTHDTDFQYFVHYAVELFQENFRPLKYSVSVLGRLHRKCVQYCRNSTGRTDINIPHTVNIPIAIKSIIVK